MKIFTFGLRKTFGLENRLHSLINYIKEKRIDLVIDVRYGSNGQKFENWDCNPENIRKAIEENFVPELVQYIWRKDLGIPFEIRKKYGNDWKNCEEWYINKITDMKIEREFLEKYINARIVFLCVENLNNPKTPECHRVWLKEYLENKIQEENWVGEEARSI